MAIIRSLLALLPTIMKVLFFLVRCYQEGQTLGMFPPEQAQAQAVGPKRPRKIARVKVEYDDGSSLVYGKDNGNGTH